MDLKVRETTYISEDMRWLGSAHGTEMTDTITLNLSLFTAGTHFPNGFLPSGLVLGKVTATGLYGIYNDALSNGQEVAVGHLYKPVYVHSDNVAGTALGAIFTHGQVVEARLPSGHGLNAAAKVDVAGRIQYV